MPTQTGKVKLVDKSMYRMLTSFVNFDRLQITLIVIRGDIMGDTGKTRKTKDAVVKGSGVGGSSAGKDKGTSDKCALTWEFIYTTTKSLSVKVGDPAGLLTSTNGKNIDLIVNSVSLGEYHETNESLIAECMEKGFAYEGKVTKVLGNSTFGIKLKGHA